MARSTCYWTGISTEGYDSNNSYQYPAGALSVSPNRPLVFRSTALLQDDMTLVSVQTIDLALIEVKWVTLQKNPVRLEEVNIMMPMLYLGQVFLTNINRGPTLNNSAPSHYLTHCWIIVIWTLRSKRRCNLNQNITRTSRTPAFWGYPPAPHDYPYYWPFHFESQFHTIDENFKNNCEKLKKYEILEYCYKLNTRHTL